MRLFFFLTSSTFLSLNLPSHHVTYRQPKFLDLHLSTMSPFSSKVSLSNRLFVCRSFFRVPIMPQCPPPIPLLFYYAPLHSQAHISSCALSPTLPPLWRLRKTHIPYPYYLPRNKSDPSPYPFSGDHSPIRTRKKCLISLPSSSGNSSLSSSSPLFELAIPYLATFRTFHV
jgi:hypothetical protein